MEYSVLSPIFHCPIFHLFFPGEYLLLLRRHTSPPRLLHKRGRGEEKFPNSFTGEGVRGGRGRGERGERRERIAQTEITPSQRSPGRKNPTLFSFLGERGSWKQSLLSRLSKK